MSIIGCQHAICCLSFHIWWVLGAYFRNLCFLNYRFLFFLLKEAFWAGLSCGIANPRGRPRSNRTEIDLEFLHTFTDDFFLCLRSAKYSLLFFLVFQVLHVSLSFVQNLYWRMMATSFYISKEVLLSSPRRCKRARLVQLSSLSTKSCSAASESCCGIGRVFIAPGFLVGRTTSRLGPS